MPQPTKYRRQIDVYSVNTKTCLENHLRNGLTSRWSTALMIHDRKRVERIREAVLNGLNRVSDLGAAVHDPALPEHIAVIEHLFEHVESFCFRLLEKEQQGTFEQESRWLDNAERMVHIATKQTESLERIFWSF